MKPQRKIALIAMGLTVSVVSACGGAGSGDAQPSADASQAGTALSGGTSDSVASVPDSGATDATASGPSTSATSGSTSTTSTTVPVALAVASAGLIEDKVDYRTGTQAEFATLSEPVDVAVGDTVRTDVTGYGEISYFDGSVTRLDIDTEFEVVALVDDPGNSEIRSRMGTGRTWHRVEQLAGDDVYEVETSVATATVRGTAFTITCPDETVCTFAVAEGVVEVELPDGTVETLSAPSSVEVGPGGFGDVVALPFDGIFGDEWVFDNADRDTANGGDTAGAIYQAYGPQYASLTGTYTGTRTITKDECSGSFCQPLDLGDVAERSYTFDVDCAVGVPCTGTVETQFTIGDVVQSESVPLTFDGTTYTWSVTRTSPVCGFDDDGDGQIDRRDGSLTNEFSWSMQPTAAEIRDGRWAVTALTGTADVTYASSDKGACDGDLTGQNSSTFAVGR